MVIAAVESPGSVSLYCHIYTAINSIIWGAKGSLTTDPFRRSIPYPVLLLIHVTLAVYPLGLLEYSPRF